MDLSQYREFCCNIHAPKIYCKELVAETMTENDHRIDPSQIYLYNGINANYQKVHTLTSAELPLLASSQFSAELTFYFQNPLLGNGYQNVTITSMYKIKNTQTELSVNLRVGNFDNIAITTNAANNNITVTLSQEASMKWICRGVI